MGRTSMRNILIFTLLLLNFKAFSTTFVPVTIKDQVGESHGIVKGEVVSVNALRSAEHGIVSRVFIKADKWMGAAVKNDHVEIYFPGGDLENESQVTHGSPRFAPGEKVVVFIKSYRGKNWVQNLGLGKFSIKRAGTEQVIVSDIFPTLPNVGQMPLKNFYQMAARLKEKKFEERFKDKYERAVEKRTSLAPSPKKAAGRKIASLAPSSTGAEKPSPLWLVLFFGLLGAGARLMKKRKS